VPRQLPLAARGFVGRTKHLAELDALLQADSVVISALDGTAGIGKTTLAVHWAHRVQHHFPDGTLHTNLRGYGPGDPATPAEVLDEFLLALGIPAERIPTGTEAKAALFRSVLAGKRVLMVLDNANAVSQVRPLLPGSPGCLVLITSRASLTGLVVNDGAHRVTLDLMTSEEATNLVRSVLGTRADADPEAVADLIRQCANLPLALRIAAGRAATQPYLEITDLVADMANDQRRWETLTIPGDEHTAVRAVFDWSYSRLTSEQARVFRRLGLHPGPDISLHAAAAVTGLTLTQARNALDILANVHLIEPISRARYRFHDLLRAYAATRSKTDDSEEDQRAGLITILEWYAYHSATTKTITHPYLADWYPGLAEIPDVNPALIFTGPAQIATWLDVERTNLIACAHTANRNQLPDLTALISLSTALDFYRLGYQDDMLQMCTLGLEATRSDGDQSAEIHALILQSEAHLMLSSWAETIRASMSALALARELNEPELAALALNNIALAYLGQNRYADAEILLKTALPSSKGAQRGRLEAVILGNLSRVHGRLGNFERALRYAERGLSLRRSANDRVGEAYALYLVAVAYQGLGDQKQVILLCREALDIDGEYQNLAERADVLHALGITLLDVGDPTQAVECWREALPIFDLYADPRADELRQRLSDMQAPPSAPAQ
jgi:tetratricopeptide (TPR) repeat protein